MKEEERVGVTDWMLAKQMVVEMVESMDHRLVANLENR
jgi:hypothetical protein